MTNKHLFPRLLPPLLTVTAAIFLLMAGALKAEAGTNGVAPSPARTGGIGADSGRLDRGPARRERSSTLGSSSAAGQVNSYVDYIPQRSEYPGQLSGVVDQLASALKSAEGAPTADAEARRSRFKPVIDQLEKLRANAARGFHDEIDFLLGYAVEKSGDLKRALSLYDRSLAMRSDNLVAAFRRGIVLLQSGDLDNALAQFKEIEWRSPSLHHEVYFEIAEVLMRQNKRDEAVKYVEKAHQAEPSFVPVLRQLVQIKTEILESTRDPGQRTQLERQILGDLGQILEKNPDDRDTSLVFAGLLLKFSDPLVDTDRIDRAAGIAKKFAEHSDYGDERAVMLLFDSLLKKRDVEGAEKALNAGLKKHPKSVQLKSGLRQLQIERGLKG